MILLQEQGRVQPRSWIFWIDVPGAVELARGCLIVARVAKRLAGIGVKQGSVRLHRRCNLQIATSFSCMPSPDFAKAAAQPGVSEKAVDFQGGIEMFLRLGH